MKDNMIPSPFHGIFSALQQEDTSTTLLHTEEQKEQDASLPTAGVQQQSGQISVDVFEQDGYIIIRAPIAGVKLADLDIEVDGKVLTIRGKRLLADDLGDGHYFVQECFWGEFGRSITLPSVVDPKKIRATFSKDSILKIIIPKEEKVKIIRINESG
jgi:HSP20 family protein